MFYVCGWLSFYNLDRYPNPTPNVVILLSCRWASAHVGSLVRMIITAAMTFSTSTGGRLNERISTRSFLFNASNAC